MQSRDLNEPKILKVFKVVKDFKVFNGIPLPKINFVLPSLNRIFGFALYTPAREYSNKFGIPLA